MHNKLNVHAASFIKHLVCKTEIDKTNHSAVTMVYCGSDIYRLHTANLLCTVAFRVSSAVIQITGRKCIKDVKFNKKQVGRGGSTCWSTYLY